MSRLGRGITWTLIGLFVLTRWRMYLTFDPVNGYDGYSHLDHLAHAFRGTLPHPSDFWQAYQAPGYYFTSAWLARLFNLDLIATGQCVSLISSCLIAVPGYWLGRRLVPGWEPLAALVLVSIPSSLLTARMVYGQQLATLFIGLFLVLLVRAWDREPSLTYGFGLGLLWAASAATRLDGLMLGLPVAALWIHRCYRGKSPRSYLHATGAMVLTGLVCLALLSPLLFRNLADYNEMFITARHPLLYPYPLREEIGLPGFWSITALLNVGWRVWVNPEMLHVESLPGFLFANFWGADQPVPVPGQLLLFAGLLASALAVGGLTTLWKHPAWYPVIYLALGNLLLMFVFLWRQPDFTNYKACYFHATYYLFALSLARGAAWLAQRRGEPLALCLACLAPVTVLIVELLR